jgi:hypothetical protein
MRCYFNLVDGSEVIRDREGIEVSDPEQARAEALHVIREQRQADFPPIDWSGWRLNVVDSTGGLLFSIPLDDPTLFNTAALGSILPVVGAQTLQDLADMFPNGVALAAIFT